MSEKNKSDGHGHTDRQPTANNKHARANQTSRKDGGIWQCINIQGVKQAWGGHWNLGILRGDSWERYKGILGAKLPILTYISPRIPPLDSQVPVSTPGLFHTLDPYEKAFGRHSKDAKIA